MIYEHALVVDIELEPYPPTYTSEEDYDEQTELKYHNLPALLFVNKLIGAEARIALYGKNQWRLPVIPPPANHPNIFIQYRPYFKTVTMAFDQRDLTGYQKTQLSKAVHAMTHDFAGAIDIDGARARAVHHSFLEGIEFVWSKAWRDSMKHHLGHVKQITIDISNFACPSGCCRSKLFRPLNRTGLRAYFLRYLQPKALAKLKTKPIPKVFIRGLLHEVERDMLIKNMGFKEAA